MCKWYKNNVQCMVSDGLEIPRITHYDLDEKFERSKITIKDDTTLRLNERHLYSLIKVDDLPEMPKDVEGNVDDLEGYKYIVETHFTN